MEELSKIEIPYPEYDAKNLFVRDDKKIIEVHPNDNTITVWLKVDDLINIIKEHGNQVYIVEI